MGMRPSSGQWNVKKCLLKGSWERSILSLPWELLKWTLALPLDGWGSSYCWWPSCSPPAGSLENTQLEEIRNIKRSQVPGDTVDWPSFAWWLRHLWTLYLNNNFLLFYKLELVFPFLSTRNHSKTNPLPSPHPHLTLQALIWIMIVSYLLYLPLKYLRFQL